MKVVVIAFSVKGAMGQYLYCWLKEMGKLIRLYLLCPSHYEFFEENYKLIKFKTSKKRLLAFFSYFNIFEFIKIKQSIEEIKPDLVHIFNGEGYPWAVLISLWLKKNKIPYVITIHDVRPHYGDLWGIINNILRYFSYKWASGIHLHTKSAYGDVSFNTIAEKKVFIIPHGNIGSLFCKNKRRVIKSNIIMFFGRIEKYKGLDLFLKACLILINEFKKDLIIVIAGPGKIGRREKKIIEKFEENKILLINKYLTYEEAGALFSKAGVCVLPYKDASQTSLIGICGTFGVPVVATAVGGLKEDVPRIGGLLVNPNHPKELAIAILESLGRYSEYPKELEFSRLSIDFVKNYSDLIKGVI